MSKDSENLLKELNDNKNKHKQAALDLSKIHAEITEISTKKKLNY